MNTSSIFKVPSPPPPPGTFEALKENPTPTPIIHDILLEGLSGPLFRHTSEQDKALEKVDESHILSSSSSSTLNPTTESPNAQIPRLASPSAQVLQQQISPGEEATFLNKSGSTFEERRAIYLKALAAKQNASEEKAKFLAKSSSGSTPRDEPTAASKDSVPRHKVLLSSDAAEELARQVAKEVEKLQQTQFPRNTQGPIYPQAPQVMNGMNITMDGTALYTTCGAEIQANNPGLITNGGTNALISEALEPPSTDEISKKCSLLLCMFRNKRYDCLSTRIEVYDPEGKPEWNDALLWETIRSACRSNITDWRRRTFGLKTIRAIRLLHYTSHSRPTRIEDETYFTKQDLMYAFSHPSKIKTQRDWIDWVFVLKSDPVNRYALEFVEDWDGMRIVRIGVTILVAVVFASVLWAGLGGDLQTVFTVTSFALAVCTTFVALLAIYSQVDH